MELARFDLLFFEEIVRVVLELLQNCLCVAHRCLPTY